MRKWTPHTHILTAEGYEGSVLRRWSSGTRVLGHTTLKPSYTSAVLTPPMLHPLPTPECVYHWQSHCCSSISVILWCTEMKLMHDKMVLRVGTSKLQCALSEFTMKYRLPFLVTSGQLAMNWAAVPGLELPNPWLGCAPSRQSWPSCKSWARAELSWAPATLCTYVCWVPPISNALHDTILEISPMTHTGNWSRRDSYWRGWRPGTRHHHSCGAGGPRPT